MNESRISTQVRKHIDTWKIRFRKGWVQYAISLRRARDPEVRDGQCEFEATLDEVSPDNQDVVTDLRGGANMIRDESLKVLRCKLLDLLTDLDLIAWKQVILIHVTSVKPESPDAVDGIVLAHGERHREIAFEWRVALQSMDETTYKRVDPERAPFVTRNAKDLLGHGTYKDEEVQVFPYSEELIAACQRLDARLDQLATALKDLVQVKNAQKLLNMFTEPGPLLLPEPTNSVLPTTP